MTARPGTTPTPQFSLLMTSGVGLITNNDETAYREVSDLAMWCQDNLSLNVIKTKEMIGDYRKRRTEHAPILINRALVEPPRHPQKNYYYLFIVTLITLLRCTVEVGSLHTHVVVIKTCFSTTPHISC